MIERNAHLDRKIGQEADTGEREEERRVKSRNYRARSSNKSFTKHYLSERSFRAATTRSNCNPEKLCREKEKEKKRERKKEQSNNDVYIDTLAAIRK